MGTLFEDFLSDWLICVLLLLDGVISSGGAVLAGGLAGDCGIAVKLKKGNIS